jgi:hypothetical protein
MIYLFNTNIVPVASIVRVTEISKDQAIATLEHQSFTSAIGHDATAQAFSTILNTKVDVNRIHANPQPFDKAISLKVNGRLAEGQVLTLNELNDIGYTLYLMEFFPHDLVIVPIEYSTSAINY